MRSTERLAATAARYLMTPRPGAAVCHDCFNFTRGFGRCYACGSTPHHIDAFAPISYSVSLGPLHHSLTAYKRAGGLCADRASRELAAILSRFLAAHEACLARAAGGSQFDLVTTVPSSDASRDEHHPLRRIVAELTVPTRSRFERVLFPAQTGVAAHRFHPARFGASRRLDGARVLLIDDTWTTGASGHGAAAALKAAGASAVGTVVIGRYVNRHWHENELRLAELAGRFDWGSCVLCAAEVHAGEAGAARELRRAA
jgi:predicted amidophosphoribosyltransferase